MKRAFIAGLVLLALLGAGAIVWASLRTDASAPLPSESDLRTSGFAVWPEDTLEEGVDACQDAESWRLDSGDTALRFARDVLEYREPYLGDPIEDWGPETVRHHAFTDADRGGLGMLIDVRKYDRCWFVVGATPREGGWPATVSYVHRAGEPQLVIQSTGERTEIGYGPWERTFTGHQQLTFNVSDIEPDATGHVISFSCRKVCDASAWTLGVVPEPASHEVDRMSADAVTRIERVCRTGGSRSRLRALAKLYSLSVNRPIETMNSKPKIGKVIVRSEKQLKRLGIRPMGNGRWSVPLRGTRTVLHAHVEHIDDRCWNTISIDDPDRDVTRSLHVDKDSMTFILSWGSTSAATVGIGSVRGGDTWELRKLRGQVTVKQFFPDPFVEPFYVVVEVRKDGKRLSQEMTWYHQVR